MRLHHWSKNTLVFVPLLIIHDFTTENVADACIAFLAFSLAASGTYVLNDLHDADADRLHPEKRNRPFASGALSRRTAYLLSPLLLLLAFGLALLLPIGFAVTLAAYVVAATAYTWIVKRMLGLDIVVLGCLYALRVVAGDEATGTDAIGADSSEWMLGFSIFFFLSLAIVKRYTELSFLVKAGKDRAPNRAYRVEDLRILIPLAAASAFNAVTIFARYIGSDDLLDTYSQPQILWLVVPILIYWLIRLMLLANRLKIQDDPVVFALRDPKSLLCGCVTALLLVWAW